MIFAGCFWAFAQVLTRSPLGVAYAVWAGVGITLVPLSGWVLLHQSLSAMQIAFIALIMIGVVGLNLTTATS